MKSTQFICGTASSASSFTAPQSLSAATTGPILLFLHVSEASRLYICGASCTLQVSAFGVPHIISQKTCTKRQCLSVLVCVTIHLGEVNLLMFYRTGYHSHQYINIKYERKKNAHMRKISRRRFSNASGEFHKLKRKE